MGKKSTENFCNYCNKTTNMVVISEMNGLKDKVWARCIKCHHLSLLEHKGSEESSMSKSATTNVKIYKPDTVFLVGDKIFHNDWEDTGKVIKKTKTSDGQAAILVMFNKLGERRLVENLKNEEIEKEI